MTRHKSKEGAFMINSIQHFQEQGVKKLIEIFSYYTDDPVSYTHLDVYKRQVVRCLSLLFLY